MTTAVASARGVVKTKPHIFSFAQGLLPVDGKKVPTDLIAGATLAALAIPEVMGYSRIAGMPVITGLYTILLPLAVFAFFGSSRHLVVGADSATAAVFFAGASTLAIPGSSAYVGYAGLAALMAAGFLILARIIRLGFLANFLSRTVLVGFLTGVGIQVALTELPGILKINISGSGTIPALVGVASHITTLNWATLILSVAIIVVIVVFKKINKRIPAALVVLIVAIAATPILHLAKDGVLTLGAVPSGLPHFRLPTFNLHAAGVLLPTAISMFVVILAQSAATSRAYAAKYNEDFDENTDLVGLGLANVAAAFTGTFVVNGSPTKTQMLDTAGGRSQIAHLCSAVLVVIVLLFLTGPLSDLPTCALAAIVFLIGVELIDIEGLRRIYGARRDEFGVAILTTVTVVFVGVEQGILLAIALSIVDHLRQGYHPRNAVIQPSSSGHFLSTAVEAGARTQEGLLIYRFGSSLYYANAQRMLDDLEIFLRDEKPLEWFCIDAPAIRDVDYSAAQMLDRLYTTLKEHKVALRWSDVTDEVRQELGRYEFAKRWSDDTFFDGPGDVMTAWKTRTPTPPAEPPKKK